MKTTIIAACLFIAQITTLFAQTKEISEKDLQAIQAEMKALSDKIEVTLKKDEKLYNAMKGDIEILNKIKIAKDKNVAFESYKSKYMTAYGQVLTKAGINMKSIVAGWSLKYKNYNFKLNNGYAVTLTMKTSAQAGGYVLPSTPTTTVTPIKDFLQSQEISCGLVGFNDVKFEEKAVSSSSTGVVAGGCSGSGTLRKEIPIPGDVKSITLKLEGKLEGSCYAVGVLGTSFSSSYTSCNAERLIVSVGAPIMWVGGATDSKEFSVEIPFEKSEQIMDVDLYASTTSVSAICCSTSGYGKATLTKAEVIIER